MPQIKSHGLLSNSIQQLLNSTNPWQKVILCGYCLVLWRETRSQASTMRMRSVTNTCPKCDQSDNRHKQRSVGLLRSQTWT
jgi:hypothetical protein